MHHNYISLPRTELEQLIKKAYLSGQSYYIKISNNIPASQDLDSYVLDEIEQICKSHAKNKQDEIDGWDGC